MAKKDKEATEEQKDLTETKAGMVKMIWTHKKVKAGDTVNCFGLPGVANEDGFLVVECSKQRAKNEMTRRPKYLIPLELYERRKELEAEAQKVLEDL